MNAPSTNNINLLITNTHLDNSTINTEVTTMTTHPLIFDKASDERLKRWLCRPRRIFNGQR